MRLARRSVAWWVVWFVGVICLLAGDLAGRPNAVHGLGVVLVVGLACLEVWRWSAGLRQRYWGRP